jgi:tetratricopeptide (TPR) repeat protein
MKKQQYAMFSINIYLRFALIVVCLVGGIFLSVYLGFWYAFPFLLAGVALLVGYIMLGTVQSAAAILQDGTNFLGAEKRLNLTLTPKLLYVTNRAYYYLLRGTIAQGLNQLDEADEWLAKAQKLKLPTDNEKAAVQLQLAGVAAQRNRWNQVKIYLKAFKELYVTEPSLKEQAKQFEQAVKNQGQMKAAQRMGMMPKGGMPLKPSGKRKRPKGR